MDTHKNNSGQVLSIPVESIRKSHVYMALKFDNSPDAKHELRSFVREICSKNALRISDILAVIKSSRESFSPELNEMLDALKNKQLKGCVQNFIYKRISSGYGTNIEYLEDWQIYKVDQSNLKEIYGPIRRSLSKVLPDFPFLTDLFYYYDNDFVNVYTTSDADLPLYINYEWPSEEDRILYKKRMEEINNGNRISKKPNLEVLAEA